jgi:hypothetical protein
MTRYGVQKEIPKEHQRHNANDDRQREEDRTHDDTAQAMINTKAIRAGVEDGVGDGCSFRMGAGRLDWSMDRTREGMHQDTRTGMNGAMQTMIGNVRRI